MAALYGRTRAALCLATPLVALLDHLVWRFRFFGRWFVCLHLDSNLMLVDSGTRQWRVNWIRIRNNTFSCIFQSCSAKLDSSK